MSKRKAHKCPDCAQPIKPGKHKKDEYCHASGCPRDRSTSAKAKAYKIPIPCSGPQKKQTNGRAKYRFVRADNVDYHPLPFGLQRSLTQLFRALGRQR